MITDIILFVSVCLLTYYFRSKRNVFDRTKLPPGPKGYPIIGNTLEMLNVDGNEMIKIFSKYAAKFGSPYYAKLLYLGDFCVVSQPQHMELILTSKSAMDKPDVFYSRLSFLNNGLVTDKGSFWLKHRRLINPVFNQRKLNHYVEIFARSSILLCKNMQNHVGPSFTCEPIFSFSLLTSILESLMDVEPEDVAESLLKTIIEGVDNEVSSISRRLSSFYTDWLHAYTADGKKTIEINNKLEAMAKYIIRLNLENRRIDAELDDCILDENANNSDPTFIERCSSLSEKTLHRDIISFLVAGYETSALSLSYLCALLALHPDVQEKVYEELQDIFGDSDRPVEASDLGRMVYLDQCVKESLRLFPIIPQILRELNEPIEIDNYVLPKGTTVVLLFDVLHRLPDIWPEPNKFKPERFEQQAIKQRHPFSFIPFSAGPRNCIGYRYAMSSIKSFLSTILRHFKIETDLKMEDLKISRVFSLEGKYIKIKLKNRK